MFSSWLEKNRRSLGLTQRELGRRLGVGGSTVGMWERGKRVPSSKNIARMRVFCTARGIMMPPPPQRPEPPEKERFCDEVRAVLRRQEKNLPSSI